MKGPPTRRAGNPSPAPRPFELPPASAHLAPDFLEREIALVTQFDHSPVVVRQAINRGPQCGFEPIGRAEERRTRAQHPRKSQVQAARRPPR